MTDEEQDILEKFLDHFFTTTEEVARRLDRDTDTAYKLMLPTSILLGNNKRIYPKSDVDALLAQRKAHPPKVGRPKQKRG